MASINIVNDKTIRISVDLEDAIKMLQEASTNIPKYARDVVTMYEKMPAFDFTSFCFYAYDTAQLFEYALGMNPRQYHSFSLDAPDSFFYALYGGMAGLYDTAKKTAEWQERYARRNQIV